MPAVRDRTEVGDHTTISSGCKGDGTGTAWVLEQFNVLLLFVHLFIIFEGGKR